MLSFTETGEGLNSSSLEIFFLFTSRLKLVKTLSTLPCYQQLRMKRCRAQLPGRIIVCQSLTLAEAILSWGQGERKTKQVIYSNLCQQLFLRKSPSNSQRERDLYQKITLEEQTSMRQIGPVPQPALW